MGKQLSVRLGDEEEKELLRMRSSLGMTESDMTNRIISAVGRMNRDELIGFLFESSVGKRLPLASVSSRAAREPIPILTRIPAGLLVLAVAVEEAIGYLSPRDVKACEGCFALRVNGDSMTNDAWEGGGVRNGDYVILNPYLEFEDGNLAAIITTDETHTLKRLYRQDSYVLCRPLNPKYDDQTVGVDEIAVIYPVCDVVPQERAFLIEKVES